MEAFGVLVDAYALMLVAVSCSAFSHSWLSSRPMRCPGTSWIAPCATVSVWHGGSQVVIRIETFAWPLAGGVDGPGPLLRRRFIRTLASCLASASRGVREVSSGTALVAQRCPACRALGETLSGGAGRQTTSSLPMCWTGAASNCSQMAAR